MTEPEEGQVDPADRYRGVLVGTAVGDALGAPVEGAGEVPPRYLDGLEVDPPLTYTDDAAMTLGVARSLVECSGFDGDHMARTLADLYEAEPWRGYGAGPPHVFRLLRQGGAWKEAAAAMFGGTGSFGNGAAMRVAPVALLAHPDSDRVAYLAHQSALITHTHPEGVDGAVAQAIAIQRVLAGEDDPARLVEVVIEYVQTDVFRIRLAEVVSVISDGRTPAERLGNGIAARDSVPTALACFLAGHSFRNVIRTAIAGGGDTDTIAAMAGALAGARYGLEGVPTGWRQVEDADRFIELADRLLELTGHT